MQSPVRVEDVDAFCRLLSTETSKGSKLSLQGLCTACWVMQRFVRIQDLTAAVLGLDVDESRTEKPHNLGIHHHLFTSEKLFNSLLSPLADLCQWEVLPVSVNSRGMWSLERATGRGHCAERAFSVRLNYWPMSV